MTFTKILGEYKHLCPPAQLSRGPSPPVPPKYPLLSEHHPTTAWVVLRVDRSSKGKTGQKVRGRAPHVDPAPEKWGSIDPWTPWLRGPWSKTAFYFKKSVILSLNSSHSIQSSLIVLPDLVAITQYYAIS